MQTFPIPYPKSSHEARLIERFGATGVRLNRRLLREGLRTFIVCFTNRSGSNLLAELLSTNPALGRAGEYFNADGVLKAATQRKFATLHRYVAWLHEARASKAGILGVKLGYQQLFFLARTGLLPAAFGDVRFIHIRRTDTLAQAVSLTIAAQTQSWTSRQAAQQQSDAVVVNEARIARAMTHLHEANAKLRCFFDVFGIRPIDVTYEELAADLRSCGERVVRELGFPGIAEASVHPSGVTLTRQASQLNEAIIRRFREKYRLSEEGFAVGGARPARQRA